MTNREVDFFASGLGPALLPQRFGAILANSADIVIVLDSNHVIEAVAVNPENGSLGCLDHWVSRPITDFLTDDSAPKLVNRLGQLDPDVPEQVVRVELNHLDNASWEFPIRYTIQSAADEHGRLIMTGRDLRPVAEIQQQLVKTQLALEKDYEKFRDFDTRYRVLMDATSIAFVVVGATSGKIIDTNAAARQMLGGSETSLSAASFASQFEGAKRSEFMENLATAARSGSAQTVIVQVRATSKRVSVRPQAFRAAGEVMMMCRLEPVSSTEPVTASLHGALISLFEGTADAVVFTNTRGEILNANDAFLVLADSPQLGDVRGMSMAEFLQRGSVDLKVIIDNAVRAGRIRTYTTRLRSLYGSELLVEISAARVTINGDGGFGFILRDIEHRESMRDVPSGQSEDEMRNVIDLVGSTPLKDIVAETAEVVEKLCIETAVNLTRNNRAAAAEMLGLSRQSLYVKLRKYGLINSGGNDGD